MCESAQCLQCFPCQFCLLEIDQKNFKKLYLAKENIPRYKSQKENCFAPFSSLGKPSDTLKRQQSLPDNDTNFSRGTHPIHIFQVVCKSSSSLSPWSASGSNSTMNLGTYTYETPSCYPSKASTQQMDKPLTWASCCLTTCAHLSRAAHLHPHLSLTILLQLHVNHELEPKSIEVNQALCQHEDILSNRIACIPIVSYSPCSCLSR